MTLQNSTLARNTVQPGSPGAAQVSGGAVYSLSYGNSFGGQRNNATLLLRNSILSDSTDGIVVISDLFSDQQTGSATVTFEANNLVKSQANGMSVVDPLLGPLADNGGHTQTLVPQPGSPALGAGDPSVCQAAPVSGVDQRGFRRPDASCSVGAVEPGAAPLDLSPAPRGTGCAVASERKPLSATGIALFLGLSLLLLAGRTRRRAALAAAPPATTH